MKLRFHKLFLPAVLALVLVTPKSALGQDVLQQALGAGEEPAAEEEAQPTDVTVAPQPPDEEIRQNLRDLLERIEDLDEFTVDVTGGIVTLDGTAATHRAVTQARELAQKVEGVNYVVNNISESQEVGERLDPALERIGERLQWLWALTPLFLLALLVFGLFLTLARLLARFPQVFRLFSRKRLVQGIIQQVVSTVIILVGLIVALEILDATALVGAVFGAAGLIGLVLGFAFKDIGENYLASVIMGLHQPFSVNDIVRIDTYEGRVARLTTRETLLISYEGNHIRLPNSLVFKSVIVNFTRNPDRRLSFLVGIGVEESLAHAQEVGIAALRDTPGIIADPAPASVVENFGDFTMNLRFFAWINQEKADWLATQSEALRAVKRAFDAEGIEMPYPIYDVNVERTPPQRKPPEEKESPPRDVGEPLEEPVRRAVEEENRLGGDDNLLK